MARIKVDNWHNKVSKQDYNIESLFCHLNSKIKQFMVKRNSYVRTFLILLNSHIFNTVYSFMLGNYKVIVEYVLMCETKMSPDCFLLIQQTMGILPMSYNRKH